MFPRWIHLSESERSCFRVAVAFLRNRLQERATVEWALRLDVREEVKRLAVLAVLDDISDQQLADPWLSAWRLIEEAWGTPISHRALDGAAHILEARIKGGDRSGTLIKEIVHLVEPVIEVKPLTESHISIRKLPRRPRSINDLMSVNLTSGKPIDPSKLGLNSIEDAGFLDELAHQLDSAVLRGLSIGHRIGWSEALRSWRLRQIHRVYFVPVNDRPPEEHEPDEFNRGIAPSVKLLHASVSRLADIELDRALGFVQRWYGMLTPIHTRLWAAFARDRRFASAKEVAAFLLNCTDHKFWDVQQYPEIAELRAIRFGDFDRGDREGILARLRRRPPRSHWSKKLDRTRVEKARVYEVTRELRRIEIAGARLPDNQRAWVADQLVHFRDLQQMTRLDAGFPGMPKARWVPPNPDNKYDLLEGTERLEALEAALSATRQGWDDGPAERAWDWMRQQDRARLLIADFEVAPNAGSDYPRVWERFGWAHAPSRLMDDGTPNTESVDPIAEAARVLTLIERLTERAIRAAIEGIAAWLSVWQETLIELERTAPVWLRIWPFAVAATNESAPEEIEADLNVIARTNDDEPTDSDTLNTPAGKLIGVFLVACQKAGATGRPFDSDHNLCAMRDAAISAIGRSALIVRQRMIEGLPWFIHVDPEWSKQQLLEPLLANDQQALTLWRAVAHQTHFTKVLEVIGEPMADRATDFRLGRDTRSSLVWSLVIESLHAFREHRSPAVPNARIQQMLRSLDDEVRAYAAQTLQRFVTELSHKGEQDSNSPSAEVLFREAARPFLEQVWPQERALATPGVARALADLPAACGEAFAEAVNAIERFLVPFECWSLLDYGLYGDDNGESKLSLIDDYEKAGALLRLLDRTIGTAEGTIVPMDLGNALEQIRHIAPQLADTQPFRRLGALSRQ